MESKERQLLEDIRAYINSCIQSPESIQWAHIVTTIAHDIGGTLSNEPCFSPRVSGYADAELKHKEAL